MAKENKSAEGTGKPVRYVTGQAAYIGERYYPKGEVVTFDEGSELQKRYDKCPWMVKLAPGAKKPTDDEIAEAEKAAAEKAALLKEQENDRARVAVGQGSADPEKQGKSEKADK